MNNKKKLQKFIGQKVQEIWMIFALSEVNVSTAYLCKTTAMMLGCCYEAAII